MLEGKSYIALEVQVTAVLFIVNFSSKKIVLFKHYAVLQIMKQPLIPLKISDFEQLLSALNLSTNSKLRVWSEQAFLFIEFKKNTLHPLVSAGNEQSALHILALLYTMGILITVLWIQLGI